MQPRGMHLWRPLSVPVLPVLLLLLLLRWRHRSPQAATIHLGLGAMVEMVGGLGANGVLVVEVGGSSGGPLQARVATDCDLGARLGGAGDGDDAAAVILLLLRRLC